MKFITGNTNKNKKILILNDFYRPHGWVNSSLIMLVDKLKNYPIHTIIYGDPSTKLSIEEWTKVQSEDTPIPDFLEKELQTHDGVIGIELPKFIINKLNEINIPYINYHHSPYRFCGINPKIWSIETGLEISNSFIPKLTPNRLISDNTYEVGTLIIGQTKYDRVLIKNNKFLSVKDFEEEIENLPPPHYFCPHQDGDIELIEWAKEKGYEFSDRPTYEMLDLNPKIVCGVNSSVLYEARDVWHLPVRFFNELHEYKNNIQLPESIAFDHNFIDSVLDANVKEAEKIISNKLFKFI